MTDVFRDTVSFAGFRACGNAVDHMRTTGVWTWICRRGKAPSNPRDPGSGPGCRVTTVCRIHRHRNYIYEFYML